MSRISDQFAALQKSGRKGFIPFITAGDPSLDHTRSILRALCRSGADLIEVGVPFSDPLADGPVIQRASQRALSSGANLSKILDLVEEFKKEASAENREVPIVLFSYLNPIWQIGMEVFAQRARAAGVDGVLITDLTPEEASSIQAVFGQHHLDLIFLIAPTSTEERIGKICAAARGFIYAVSRTGTTGTRESLSEGVEALVARIHQHTSLPIAVGFGISTRDQVATVWKYADAAVVGSAIVRAIEKEIENNPALKGDQEALAEKVEVFVRCLLPTAGK